MLRIFGHKYGHFSQCALYFIFILKLFLPFQSSRESSSGAKKCPLCNKARTVHRNTHEQSTKRGHIYKCCKCSASRLPSKKFFEHVQNHIVKKHQCSICQKGFSQERILANHIFMEHGEGKGQRFHCNYENCNFDAKYPNTLATHIKGEILEKLRKTMKLEK